MFWFSAALAEMVLQIGLGPDDFEPEEGQIDGTTAHAVERLFGVIGLSNDGLYVTDGHSLRKATLKTDVNHNYRFAP